MAQIVKLLPSAPTFVITGVAKGVFAAGTTYAVGEVVTYAGGTYMMHTLAVAGTLPTDTTAWQAMSSPQGYVESLTQLVLVNATTDNTIDIDQNGNVGTDVATDGALHIENTGNTGIGLGVYTNIGATAEAELVSIKINNVAFDEEALKIVDNGVGVTILADKNSDGLVLSCDKDVTNANQTGAVDIVATSVVNDAGTYTKTGAIVSITSDVTETSGTITDSAQVLLLTQSHAEATGAVEKISNAGAGYALQITCSNAAANTGLYLEQTGVLAGGKYGAHFYSNAVLNGTASRLVQITVDNASSTNTAFGIQQDGSGAGMKIDQNGALQALIIEHDDTGATSSVKIDRNGDNAVRIFGLEILVDNAGSGNLVGGIDFSGMEDGEPLFKFKSLDTDLSSKNPETDAEAGFFSVLVGTTIYAVPVYALS